MFQHHRAVIFDGLLALHQQLGHCKHSPMWQEDCFRLYDIQRHSVRWLKRASHYVHTLILHGCDRQSLLLRLTETCHNLYHLWQYALQEGLETRYLDRLKALYDAAFSLLPQGCRLQLPLFDVATVMQRNWQTPRFAHIQTWLTERLSATVSRLSLRSASESTTGTQLKLNLLPSF